MGDIVAKSGFHGLSIPEQESHRAKVGVRAKAILSQFWHDANTEAAVQVLEVEGWMDVLEDCSHSEIRDAWKSYQTNPNNRTQKGRLAKPDAGALKMIVLSKRPRPPQPIFKPKPAPAPPTEAENKRIADLIEKYNRIGVSAPGGRQ